MKNWYGTWALFKRETWRFLKVWVQTIGSPVISAFLYFAIFGAAIGTRVHEVNGVPYLLFLVPGLAAMKMIFNSFMNSGSSMLIQKFRGTIQSDLIALPITSFQIVLAYMGGAIIRGVLVGIIVLGVSFFFVGFHLAHPLLFLLSSFLMTGVFGLIGIITGLWANVFDEFSIISDFFLTPLTYLSGVFFSVSMLPAAWSVVVYFNPLFYLIDLFRYSIVGVAESSVLLSLGATSLIFLFLFILCIWLIEKGWKIKA